MTFVDLIAASDIGGVFDLVNDSLWACGVQASSALSRIGTNAKDQSCQRPPVLGTALHLPGSVDASWCSMSPLVCHRCRRACWEWSGVKGVPRQFVAAVQIDPAKDH